MSELKNKWYIESISGIDSSQLLPGVKNLLEDIKNLGFSISLGSASQNSVRILEATGVIGLFDAIIDATITTKSKPHPQVFEMGAEALGFDPSECVVFEDSINGIKSANTGGFISIGVGSAEILHEADIVLPDLDGVTVASVVDQVMNLRR